MESDSLTKGAKRTKNVATNTPTDELHVRVELRRVHANLRGANHRPCQDFKTLCSENRIRHTIDIVSWCVQESANVRSWAAKRPRITLRDLNGREDALDSAPQDPLAAIDRPR